MTSAQTLRPAPSSLAQVLAGGQWLWQQLETAFGVTVTIGDRTSGPLARWTLATRTLTFRHDATALNMAWGVQQLWTMLAVGPHAAVGYRPAPSAPTLRLIPTPRDANGR